MSRVHRVDPNGRGSGESAAAAASPIATGTGATCPTPASWSGSRPWPSLPRGRRSGSSPDPDGHIQATGVDAAGRKQYVYHEAWTRRRGREKYRRIEGFGRSLPKLRRRVSRDLARPGFPRERTLAAALRLLDRSAVRVGGEEYARRNGTYGLATLRRSDVRVSDGRLELRFVGKAGKEHALVVRDPAVARLVRELRPEGTDRLLAWTDGTRWRDVRASDINDYLRDVIGDGYSAKDFRTWNATVLAASMLASHDPSEGTRAVRAVVRQVAEHLGNTPAVARASYVDPRIVDRFLDEGRTIVPVGRGRRASEEAVLALLDGDG